MATTIWGDGEDILNTDLSKFEIRARFVSGTPSASSPWRWCASSSAAFEVSLLLRHQNIITIPTVILLFSQSNIFSAAIFIDLIHQWPGERVHVSLLDPLVLSLFIIPVYAIGFSPMVLWSTEGPNICFYILGVSVLGHASLICFYQFAMCRLLLLSWLVYIYATMDIFVNSWRISASSFSNKLFLVMH